MFSVTDKAIGVFFFSSCGGVLGEGGPQQWTIMRAGWPSGGPNFAGVPAALSVSTSAVGFAWGRVLFSTVMDGLVARR